MALLEAAQHRGWALHELGDLVEERRVLPDAPAGPRGRRATPRSGCAPCAPRRRRARGPARAGRRSRAGGRPDAARARGSGARSVIRPLFTSAKTTGTTSCAVERDHPVHRPGEALLHVAPAHALLELDAVHRRPEDARRGARSPARPASVTSAARYSPLGVCTLRSSATGTPLRLGELLAARVGFRPCRTRPSPRGPSPAGWRRGSGPPRPPPARPGAAGCRRCATAPCSSRAPSSARRRRAPGAARRAGSTDAARAAPRCRSRRGDPRSRPSGSARNDSQLLLAGLPSSSGGCWPTVHPVFTSGKPSSLAHLEVALGAGAGVVPHPLDEPGALGDADRPARVEQVEGVRALQRVVVGRQRQPLRR